MEFDEQLAHTLESIADRLRDGVAQQLRSAADELAAIVSSELTAVGAERDAARADRDKATADRDSAAAERDAAHAERDTASAERDRANAERDTANAERDTANAERDSANADRDTATAERDQSNAARDAGRHADEETAARERSVHSLLEHIRAIDAAHSLSEVLDTIVRCAGQHAPRAGVLIVRGGRFHGWRFAGFDPAPDRDAPLDLSPAEAGIVADAAERRAVVDDVDDVDVGRTGDAAPRPPSFAGVSPGRPFVAAPLIVSGQTVAVLYADGGLESPEPGTWNPGPVEILALHASRCLEALTAMTAARALARHTAASPAPADRAFDAADAAAHESSADAFASAKRYARLLVSEIKLYHEAQVMAGRRDRDLAIRLGGEIARVRALYEQRVPLDVRRHTDFVHEELVRTLADGDAALLDMGT